MTTRDAPPRPEPAAPPRPDTVTQATSEEWDMADVSRQVADASAAAQQVARKAERIRRMAGWGKAGAFPVPDAEARDMADIADAHIPVDV